jgi:shikimate O-hydroxycinnamoyltransferase
MAASRAATGSSRPSILRQAMNMQQRTQSSLLNGASGNIVCCATAFATAEMFIGLHKLSNTLSEAIAKLDDDCEKSTKERKEFKVFCKAYI